VPCWRWMVCGVSERVKGQKWIGDRGLEGGKPVQHQEIYNQRTTGQGDAGRLFHNQWNVLARAGLAVPLWHTKFRRGRNGGVFSSTTLTTLFFVTLTEAGVGAVFLIAALAVVPDGFDADVAFGADANDQRRSGKRRRHLGRQENQNQHPSKHQHTLSPALP